MPGRVRHEITSLYLPSARNLQVDMPKYGSLFVGLLQLVVLFPKIAQADALAVPSQQQQAEQQVQPFRLQVGSECEQTADCIGGECRPDTTGSGKKYCLCLDGTFRYIIAPALEICLKCRDLNSLCSFDQECQCSDSNAVCDILPPSGKGRCKCRENYLPFFEGRMKAGARGNFTCKTGGVQSICRSDQDCAAIKFLDCNGKPRGLRDATGRRKTDIQAKCHFRQPIATTPIPLADIMVMEELDVFDVTNVTLPPASVPEPRSTDNATLLQGNCHCPDGFTVSTNDSYVCQDVDECTDDPCNPTRALDNAHTTCVNTFGGFRCECNSTMSLGQGLPPGGICCDEGYIPCLDSTRCIPFNRLCDGFPDCEADCSDELYPFCNFNNYRPFPDFSHFPQCHEGFVQEDVMNNNQQVSSKIPGQQAKYEDLLPLGASTSSSQLVATPNFPIPTLPANITAARLLGFVLV